MASLTHRLVATVARSHLVSWRTCSGAAAGAATTSVGAVSMHTACTARADAQPGNEFGTNTSKAASNLFVDAKQVGAYAAHRPTYPAELFTLLNKTLADAGAIFGNNRRSLAIDAGCGSGQATVGLSYIFSQGRVIGTDISEPQVAAANAKPNLPSNVSFEVSAGEVLPAEDGEVDLVTVAQALHWFDLPRFYPECARALRSGGILAMFGYELPTFNNAEADAVLLKHHNQTLGPFWAPGRWHVVNAYRDLLPSGGAAEPFTGLRVVRKGDPGELAIERQMTMEEVIGYLRSWSGYATMREAHPDDVDPLINVERELRETFNLAPDDQESTIVFTFPMFVITMARK